MTVNSDYEKLQIKALEWIKKQMRPFTLNDLRKSLHDEIKHLVIANSAWGMLMKQMAKDKYILNNGYTDVLRPNGKKHAVVHGFLRSTTISSLITLRGIN